MRSTRPIVSSLRTETTSKLTPTLKRWLEFLTDGGERGRMVLQATASGGRAASQLQSLRNAGYVEYCDDPDNPTGPDRVRVTEAGKKALAGTRLKEPLTYRPVGDRYIVNLGDDRLGFVRRDLHATSDRCWTSIRLWNGRAGLRPAVRQGRRCSAATSRHATANGADDTCGNPLLPWASRGTRG
jgi:hypothetical protein